MTKNPFGDPDHPIEYGLFGRDLPVQRDPMLYRVRPPALPTPPAATRPVHPAGALPPDAVSVFEILAERTWRTLDAAERLGIPQSEETITDNNLLTLALAALPNVRVYKATRAEESVRGFDWEWWIGTPSRGWWRYSVQAKRLDIPSQSYRSLRHKVRGRYQLDILADFARSQGSIALYCFYNWTDPQSAQVSWNCNLAYEEEQLGCTVVPLEVVARFIGPRRRRKFAVVHMDWRALPWRCLVRCPYVDDSLTQRRGHPLAGTRDEPRWYEALPQQIGRESADGSVILEGPMYRSELGGFPERLAVFDIQPLG